MGEREGQGMAFESLVPRSSPSKLAAWAAAKSLGVLYPKLLCGHSSLYSFRYTAIFRRATSEFCTQLTARHSSRNRP